MQTSSPRLGPNAAGSRGARDNAHVVTLIQEALCSGDARCVVEAVEKACRLKGLPVPHEPGHDNGRHEGRKNDGRRDNWDGPR